MGHKIHATKLLIGEQTSAYRSVHRNEVVLDRLKLGHSYLTHSCLLKGKPPAEYVTYHCHLTINHILVIYCVELGHSYLTHSCLLEGKPPLECVTYHCRLTINHILVIDCVEYAIIRLILFDNNVNIYLKTYLIMCLQTKSSHLSKEMDCTTLRNSIFF